MEPFGLTALDWGLVALLVFPLAQLPLVFYLARYVTVSDEETLDHAVEFRTTTPENAPEESDAEPTPDRFDRSRPRDARPTGSRRSMPSRIVCQACGVENDPAFTYCRSCVERLSNPRPVASPNLPQ